jgi:hypothetical protein
LESDQDGGNKGTIYTMSAKGGNATRRTDDGYGHGGFDGQPKP